MVTDLNLVQAARGFLTVCLGHMPFLYKELITCMYVCKYGIKLCLSRPPHLGRPLDIKVEKKHYKASVCVVCYMNMCLYECRGLVCVSHVNSFLPVDQGLPNRDEEVSATVWYVWSPLLLCSNIVSLQHVDCWIFWKLLHHTNTFTSYGSSAI